MRKAVLVFCLALLAGCTSIPVKRPIPLETSRIVQLGQTDPTGIVPKNEMKPSSAAALPTEIPQNTPTVYDFVQRSHDPAEWEFQPEIPVEGHFLYKDHEKRLWSLKEENLAYFVEGKWNIVTQNGVGVTNPDLIGLTPAGEIWLIGGRLGRISLVRYKNHQLTYYPIPDTMSKSLVTTTLDAEGRIWAITGAHLNRFDGSIWDTFALPPELSSRTYFPLADGKGNIWIGNSWREGIYRFDGKNWYRFPGKELWPDVSYYDTNIGYIDIKAGPEGSIWAKLGINPLIIRIHPDGAVTKIPALFLSYGFGDRMTMLVDKDNHLWLGNNDSSSSNVLIAYDGFQWSSFKGLPFKSISHIKDDGDELMIWTEKGLYFYKPSK
jgi:hypothetical protein